MTMIVFVIVLVAIAAVVVAAGRFGADSRSHDPGCIEPNWPFARHGS